MSQEKKPVLHTDEQEAQVLAMITPVLDVIESEYGAWGIDCVKDLCRGRLMELSTPIHKT